MLTLLSPWDMREIVINNYLYCQDLPTEPRPDMGIVLVTGASGYIGGRLVPELIYRKYRVRVMVRAYSSEYAQRWPGVEVVVADALDIAGVRKAMEGVDTVYYLIHSLLLGPLEFEHADIKSAENFRIAAEECKVRRIIYLGGLGDTNYKLSPHLRSRMAVAQELQRGAVPVTVLRAAVIIGSGSASYEIVYNLVRLLPIILLPAFSFTRCQPIGVRDVIKYLVGVLEKDETVGCCYDIGGPDVLSYKDMMQEFSRILGKQSLYLPSPVSNITLFSYLASLLTPVPHHIVRCLLESITYEVICKNDSIRQIVPLRLMRYREAVVAALSREEQDQVSTRWSDAYPPAHELSMKLKEQPGSPEYSYTYSMLTARDSNVLFKSVCSVGGSGGWFHSNWLWRLRGWLDRLIMGVGSLRGRRSRSTLRINDVIDFWRVEDMQENRLLLLRAEMKLPGKAWLQFSIDPEQGMNRLTVKAYFYTSGIIGRAYWHACMPLHVLIFDNLVKQIEKRTE